MICHNMETIGSNAAQLSPHTDMQEITTINNERMAAFIATIIKQTQVILHERADDILKAWHENMEEANANEDKLPPLKLSIGSTVDLESAKIDTAVTFTTRYKTTLSAPLPDPNQMELPKL